MPEALFRKNRQSKRVEKDIGKLRMKEDEK